MKPKTWISLALIAIVFVCLNKIGNVGTWFQIHSTQVKSESLIKHLSDSTNVGVRQWSVSMGDIGGDGVILNCSMYPEGPITNVYLLPGGILATQSITWPISTELLGSHEYESKAQMGYEKHVAIDPALSEIREIVEDCMFENVQSSLYSSIWEVYVIRSQIRQLKRRQQEGKLLTYGLNQKQALSGKDFGFDTVYSRYRLEQLVYYEVGKYRLEKMLGGVSDDCFRRLMSIDVFSAPLDLSGF